LKRSPRSMASGSESCNVSFVAWPEVINQSFFTLDSPMTANDQFQISIANPLQYCCPFPVYRY
jgi:hypothetical protein